MRFVTEFVPDSGRCVAGKHWTHEDTDVNLHFCRRQKPVARKGASDQLSRGEARVRFTHIAHRTTAQRRRLRPGMFMTLFFVRRKQRKGRSVGSEYCPSLGF